MKQKTKPNVLNLPRFRGGPLALLTNHDHEVILSGGSDIGKTWAGCVKCYMLCSDQNRKNVHGIMVRKTFKSIRESGARTFNTITEGMPIRQLGGAMYTDRWVFPNGSELVCCGMDSPEKLLGSEWDFVYVIQSEQLTESEWEIIASRCTGRGATVAYPQIFGDCNPGGSKHWIPERAKKGKLTLLESTHRDNPALYDDAGNVTEEGVKRLTILQSTLSGVRYQRLFEGKWTTAEGAVYDMFDAQIHVLVRERGEMQRFYLALDQGFTNPAAILDIGSDPDGRWHVFREFYKSGKVEEEVAEEAKLWHRERPVDLAAVDEAAAGLIQAMKAKGIPAVSGKGKIYDGISKIRNRLKVAGDGKPRLTVDPSCVNTINEFESYIIKPGTDLPLDKDNHAVGALRYLSDALNEPTGAFTPESVAGIVAPPLKNEHGFQPRGWPGRNG